MQPRNFLLANLIIWTGLAGAQPVTSQTKVVTPAQKALVVVPFVGCASDGQVGPQAAPAGKSKVMAIPAQDAQRLAYYQAKEGPGVLAPRGWHCFSTYGANGSSLFVSPDHMDAKVLFSRDWKGFSGQAVEVSAMLGGTSGRFEVAKVIARVFSAYKAFAQEVIAEGIEPASDFPLGSYMNDELTYRGKNVVEFETPANTEGLGTDSWLQANSSPIDGVAIIVGGGTDEDTNLVQLSARLSLRDRDLIPTLVHQVESEAGHSGAQ